MNAAASHTVVESELAYDLLQDHTELVLALLERPMPKGEVIEMLGSETPLKRLLKHGLVSQEGNTIYAVAEAYTQARQEGMVTFLERYILPSLSASLSVGSDVDPGGIANVWSVALKLSPKALDTVRPDNIDEFFDELLKASDLPAQGTLSRLSVLVIGTSQEIDSEISKEDAILKQLKCASIQRSTANEKHLAILSQFDCLADSTRFEAARDVVQKLVDKVDVQRATTPSEANYHLTVATHWRCTAAIGMDNEVEASQLC